MSEPTYCPEGGWIVSTHPVPEDAADHWVSAVRDIIGCNRLNCLACGRKVRSAPNLRPRDGDLAEHLGEMAASDDWSALPYLERSHGCRLYACACFHRHEVSRHLAEERDPDRRPDITFPWACGGHPPPALPLDVDGWTIDGTTDVAALAQRALTEGAPDTASMGFREYPAGWLGRIYYRLRGLPEADTLALAVGELLRSAAPDVIGGALAFYRLWPDAAGVEQVLALADAVGAATTFPSRFDILEIPESAGATLLAHIWDADDIGPAIVGHLEALALDPDAGGMKPQQLDKLLRVLAEHSGEFLARQAAMIGHGDQRRAKALLRAIRESGRGELVVVAGTVLLQDGGYRVALSEFLASPFSAGEPWTAVLASALSPPAG